ncbi:MAG: hypothetical protein O2866_00520 [archaeon]|nr:hypothetical protein [archaeon]
MGEDSKEGAFAFLEDEIKLIVGDEFDYEACKNLYFLLLQIEYIDLIFSRMSWVERKHYNFVYIASCFIFTAMKKSLQKLLNNQEIHFLNKNCQMSSTDSCKHHIDSNLNSANIFIIGWTKEVWKGGF